MLNFSAILSNYNASTIMTVYICRRLIPTTAFLVLFVFNFFSIFRNSAVKQKYYPLVQGAPAAWHTHAMIHFASRSYATGLCDPTKITDG